MSKLGPFLGDRAYFGLLTLDHADGLTIEGPSLLLLSPGADPEAEIAAKDGLTGQILETRILVQPSGGPWPGIWVADLRLVDDGNYGFPPSAELTIEALAGSWDVADPDDPPRLQGSFAGSFHGAIDAVYCDKLDELIDPHP